MWIMTYSVVYVRFDPVVRRERVANGEDCVEGREETEEEDSEWGERH